MTLDSDDKKLEEASGEYQTCPNCALPHKMTDTICSFCGEKLAGTPAYGEKLRRAVESAKWRFKLKSPRAKTTNLAKSVGVNMLTLLLGAGLTGLGGWFFYGALVSGSFSGFLIGALFLLYGLYSIYNIFARKG